jgi:hypothetical protein
MKLTAALWAVLVLAAMAEAALTLVAPPFMRVIFLADDPDPESG